MAFKTLFFFLVNSLAWSATIHDAVWRDSNNRLDEIYPVVNLSLPPPSTTPIDVLNTSLEEGESESDAIKVYIPLDTGNNRDYFTRDVLPGIISSTSGTGRVHFRLQVNLENDPRPQYLHAAVKNSDGDYTIIEFEDDSANSSTFIRLDSNTGNLPVIVGFNELCPVIDCEKFITSTTRPPNTADDYHLLFFVSETQYSEGQEIAETEPPAKLFYQLYLSNRIDARSEIHLASLYKGDGQLHPTFNGFSPLPLHSESLHAYVVEGSAPPCPPPANNTTIEYGTARSNNPNGRLQSLDTLSTGGDTDVKNLKNGHCYTVRLLYVDQFGFASRLSRPLVESPEVIPALLQTDQCYLLTAGFGREHFVIDFFRNFRDRVLLSFSLGRVAVSAYYATAPSYVPLILKSPILAFGVRGVAWTLYAVLRYFPYVLATGLLLVLFSFYRRRHYGGP